MKNLLDGKYYDYNDEKWKQIEDETVRIEVRRRASDIQLQTYNALQRLEGSRNKLLRDTKNNLG